jgi:hypothetical protein
VAFAKFAMNFHAKPDNFESLVFVEQITHPKFLIRGNL